MGNHRPLAEFAACGVTVSRTNNEVCCDGPELSRAQVRGFSGQVDWTLAGSNTLTSITAYRTREVGPNYASIDTSEGYDKIRNLTPFQDAKQFSQELRIASPAKQPIEYVLGLSMPIRSSTSAPLPPYCLPLTCPRRRRRARSSTPPRKPRRPTPARCSARPPSA